MKFNVPAPPLPVETFNGGGGIILHVVIFENFLESTEKLYLSTSKAFHRLTIMVISCPQ